MPLPRCSTTYKSEIKGTIMSNMKGNSGTLRKDPQTQIWVIRGGRRWKQSGKSVAVLTTVRITAVHIASRQ